MIQHYLELNTRVSNYNTFISEQQVDRIGQVQKVFSTAHFICLVTRFPGKTKYIYLGRGSGNEGMWVEDFPPPSRFRIRDRFLEYLRKFLVGVRISQIILDPNDRILYIPYYCAGKASVLSLFYKGRLLYFSNLHQKAGGHQLFHSWEKLKDNSLEFDDVGEGVSLVQKHFDAIGRLQDKRESSDSCGELPSLKSVFDSHKSSTAKVTTRKKKFLMRKKKKIEQDLIKVRRWSELKRTIENVEFSFSEDYVNKICGFDFKFETGLSHFKKMNLVYQKVKKLKLGETILSERLLDCEKEILGIADRKIEETKVDQKIIEPVWSKSDDKKKTIKKLKDFEVVEFKFGEVRAAVGLNTQANDYLRSEWANKNDFWFHAEGEKSGHLIIKVQDLSSIEDSWFDIIGSIIRDYGKLSFEQIPLIFTQVKNLKGIKGRAGAVTYKKVKHRTTQYKSNWKEIISMY